MNALAGADVILLDQKMQGGLGTDFVQQWRGAGPTAKAIGLAGFGPDETRQAFLFAEADNVVRNYQCLDGGAETVIERFLVQ